MDQFRAFNHAMKGTVYDGTHKIMGNALPPYMSIKKEIDTTMNDGNNSNKLEPQCSYMPIKNEIDTKMHNFDYSTNLYPLTNIKQEIDDYSTNLYPHTNSKQEIDSAGGDFHYNAESKIENKAMGVEQYLSNLFSRKTDEASIDYTKASGVMPNNESYLGNESKGNYFKCQYCDYTSSSWLHYKNHRLIHKEKVVRKELCKCIKCNKFFQQNDVLVKHRGRGRSKKSKHFTCLHCEKDQELHSHKKSHTCSHCEMSFPEESKLTMHMSLHTGSLKPNQCSHCGKCCVSAVGLARHRRLAQH